MNYSLGVSLADYGFAFFEKIHAPIFLIHRLGKISKINEAGRKLLRIAKVSVQDVEAFASSQLGLPLCSQTNCKRFRIADTELNLIARRVGESDFILVEVLR